MARVPTAVSVVTALGPQGPAGATANAVTSLSLNPPLMLACLDRESRTLAVVRERKRFGINFLATDRAELARRFSRKDPSPDKWAGVDWEARTDVPALAGVVVWIACDLRDTFDGGDHVILTGEVLDLSANAGEPLVFHGGDYLRLELP